MDAFERRWKLIELLLTGPKLRQWLLDELSRLDEDDRGLSGPTLSQDVKALREIGIGFATLGPQDKRSRQSYKLDFERLPIWASPEDAEALLAAANVFETLGLIEARSLRAMYDRVPVRTREYVREPYSDRFLATSTTAHDPEVLRRLQAATKTGTPMWIGYQPIGKAARRYYVDKAYVTWQDGGLYLHAHCPQELGEHKALKNREFRLDRFSRVGDQPAVEVLEGQVTQEDQFPTFDLQLKVVPSFAPRFRKIPDRMWVYPQPDGSAIVKTVEPILLRAVRRVLSYGDLVSVISPDFVRTELQQLYARMLDSLGEHSDG